jgi:ATP-dependent Clp protease ATP-binding subunit ClpC
MFERFTDTSKRVLVLADEEARLFNHSFIGTEHLLLGLTREGRSIAATTLESFGVSLERGREKVEEFIGAEEFRGTPAVHRSAPLTLRATAALAWSESEASQRGDSNVRPEHLLLGVLHASAGVGARILRSLGADLYRVREALVADMTDPPDEPRIET